MVDGIIRRTLRGHRVFVKSHASLRQRQRVHNRNDAVNGGAGPHAGPRERLEQRLRQRQT